MEMPDRNATPNKYRFGYNVMEKDDEVKNLSGSSYTTEFRQYDPRLGRWLSLDPLMQQFPSMSPYVAFDDNPIYFTDPLGLAAEGSGDRQTRRDRREREAIEAKANKAAEIEHQKHQNRIDEVVVKPSGGAPTTWEQKEYKITAQASDNAQFVLPRQMTTTLAEKKAENDAKWKPRIAYFNDGRDMSIQFAEDMARRYDIVLDNAIPGWDLAQRLAAGETISGTDVFVEGIGVIPVGRLFTKGGKLFVRGAKSTDEAIDVTKKSVSACFVKGTKISTEDGLKDIESIQVGDTVWAFDEQTLMNTLKPVTETMVFQSDHLLKFVFDNHTLFTTNDHPFYHNGNWVEARNLNIGDSLHLLNNTKTVIQHKERIDTLVTVYNFEVADVHNYYVGEDQILVHNKPKPRKNIPGFPKVFDETLEKIKSGEGVPRIDPSTGKQTVFQGRGMGPIQKAKWENALEWDVPGTSHRILQKTMPDGTVIYGRVVNHNYSTIYQFK
jgi:RHS repeat-associated protein